MFFHDPRNTVSTWCAIRKLLKTPIVATSMVSVLRTMI